MKLFHCKISFYRQGYPSSCREKHWQTKGGRKKEGWCMVLHQGHSSMYSVPSLLQGSTADWDTQAAKGGVPTKPTEPPLVQAPPLLCSFPSTVVPSLPAESCKLLPFQEPLHLAPTNTGATASATREQRSQQTVRNCKAAQSHILRPLPTALWETASRQRAKKPGSNQQGWIYAVSWYHFSRISQQLQEQKVVSWFSVGYGFPVADANSSTTKSVIKKCRRGENPLLGWPTPEPCIS